MPGIYIHAPFCDGKCPYCDFYSLPVSEERMDRYTDQITKQLLLFGERNLSAPTVYFGGGTPSLLGAWRLSKILDAIAKSFRLEAGAEITLEANPRTVDEAFFSAIRKSGFNRVSIGLQSGDEQELVLLQRRHTVQSAAEAVRNARAGGFENLSVDLMLALPGQTKEVLSHSIDFAAGLEAQHVSAYILKVEEKTPFAVRYWPEDLPDEELSRELYLFMSEKLENLGYCQYEISNFSEKGYESRHNLLYWRCEEYLGFGPSAHSFYEGRRFFYPADLKLFLDGVSPVPDGAGGEFDEYAMLALRLTEGLRRIVCAKHYPKGNELYDAVLKNTKKCPPGLLRADSEHISLTKEGFAISNAVIGTLLSGF